MHEDVLTDAAVSLPADARRLVPFGASTPRALVVDDDPLMRDLFSRVLRAAGIETMVASDGASALEILRSDPAHVVILDNFMPGMTGLTLIQQLRADSATVNIPVILVTGEADLADRVRGLELGADDYLTKPVEPDELVVRVRAQLRRGFSADPLRTFVESANDAFVAWDGDGLITEWTKHAEVLFGWSRSEIIGAPFSATVLASRHRKTYADRMRRFAAAGEAPMLGEWVELTGRHRDGRDIPIEMTVWVVDEHGRHIYSAFMRDLSAKRDIQNALRDSARLQALVESAPDLIMLTDTDGVILYVSPSARDILGYDPDDLYGRCCDDIVHADDRVNFIRARGRSLASGADLATTHRVITNDGGHVWVESSSAALRHPVTGRITGLELVARDITRRKLAEQEREQVMSDLARVNADLRDAISREQRMVEELQQLDRIKTEFVATVSHELRTPLTSISGYVEMLVDQGAGGLSDRQHAMLEVVERNTRRLLMMIDNLLTIGRIEAGAVDIDATPIEALPLVRAAVRAMLPTARERGVEIHIAFGTNPGLVLADAAQLDRALLNVLSNAVKFTGEGGRVTVAIDRSATDVLISISDTGVGIPLDEQSDLFTPFFRSSTAVKSETQGTGLGLVIVKNIIEGHEGTIRIDSTPEVGTTVTLTLPASPEPLVVHPNGHQLQKEGNHHAVDSHR
jgi:PAS domain S-box-containing protein